MLARQTLREADAEINPVEMPGAFHKEVVMAYMRDWRHTVEQDANAETRASRRQLLDEFEDEFWKWYRTDNPLGKLENYFMSRNFESEATKRSVRSLSIAYMRFCNWEFDANPTTVDAFLASRYNTAKSSSRRTYGSYLRILFKAQGIHRMFLPFEDDPIKISEKDTPKPKVMPRQKLIEFIGKVKVSGNPRAGYYGVLATWLAPRPIEMGEVITTESMDTDNHIIRFKTKKHGRVRVHYIPDILRPYLYNYQPKLVAEWQMNRLWYYICRDIGFRPGSGYSWYSVRRAVQTHLSTQSGITGQALDCWGGWKTGVVSGAQMSRRYTQPSELDLIDIDKEVTPRHPFIGYWNHSNNANGSNDGQFE